MTNTNALSVLAIGWIVGIAFLLAGPAERMLEASCPNHAPTARACARW